MKTLTAKEIINSIIARIQKQGGRCVVGDICKLKIGDRMCAFSMCMTDEAREQAIFDEPSLGSGVSTIKHRQEVQGKTLDDALKPQYRGHSKQFWSDVQCLHDEERYWNADFTLSDRGESRVKALLSQCAAPNF